MKHLRKNRSTYIVSLWYKNYFSQIIDIFLYSRLIYYMRNRINRFFQLACLLSLLFFLFLFFFITWQNNYVPFIFGHPVCKRYEPYAVWQSDDWRRRDPPLIPLSQLYASSSGTRWRQRGSRWRQAREVLTARKKREGRKERVAELANG